MKRAWIGLLLALSSGVACRAAEPVPVKPMAELRRLIADAAAHGAKRVVIPPGIYRGAPEGHDAVHLSLTEVSNLEIVADHVAMLCTRRTRAVAFSRCRNVSLRGLTIDYDPLTFTQGKVVAAADDKSWIDVKIDAGYPRQPWSRIDVVDPATRYRAKGMPFLWGTTAELVQPDVVRVRLKGIGAAAPVGMLASLNAGNDEGGVCHGVTMDDCGGGMALRNVTIHCAPGMGIVEAGGEGGTVLDGVRIVPGPKPAGATEERLLTTSWDGILHESVGKGPVVENCVIEKCGDDSWSDQSSDYLTLKRTGANTILAARSYAMWLRVGDRLRFANDSPEWRIVSVEPVTPKEAGLEPEAVERVATARPYSPWKIGDHWARVTLDRPATFDVGQSLYSPDRQGNGFVFRSNRVHSAGRILVKASDGVIEDNRLLAPHGVVLCPEQPGECAAGIHDVAIRRNTIVESGFFCPAPWSSQAGAISISAEGPGSQFHAAGVFDRITIEDNTFRGIRGVNLCIASAKNVLVKGNRFMETHRSQPTDTGARYRIDQSAVIWVGASSDVRFADNRIIGRGPFSTRITALESTARNVTGADSGFGARPAGH